MTWRKQRKWRRLVEQGVDPHAAALKVGVDRSPRWLVWDGEAHRFRRQPRRPWLWRLADWITS